jgi:molecular chaperone HscB
MSQHFTLFQLEPAFDIDTAALEQTYRSLAARFHPDRHAAASAFEQKQAMMMASAVNEAYRILKNPIDRAAYLLEQHDIHADAPEHTTFPPEFLMQQMEWREALAPCWHWKPISKPSKTPCSSALQSAFKQNDYHNAANLVRQGRFLNKLRQEIQAAQ